MTIKVEKFNINATSRTVTITINDDESTTETLRRTATFKENQMPEFQRFIGKCIGNEVDLLKRLWHG